MSSVCDKPNRNITARNPFFFTAKRGGIMPDVRQPQQKRSIETKNKILSAAYELFSEAGYHNVNTKDIAERAGVSTGIIYGYFNNKKDILLDVIDVYLKKIFTPIKDMTDELTYPVDFTALIKHVLNETIRTHQTNEQIHQVLHSLSGTDKDVEEKFLTLEENITVNLAEKLSEIGYKTESLREKIHFAMNVVQFYAHECVYDKHTYINYEAMEKIVADCLIGLFE